MKKIILVALTIFALILTACNTASSSPQVGSTTTTESLPVATQLVVGVFKLEETENAVTAEQATELLPLWQVYKELLNSDTTAHEEIDALVEQLQKTMTTEQIQTITDMNLSQQDALTVIQAYGMGSTQSSNTLNNNGTSSQDGGGFAPPDGGLLMNASPDGGIPGGLASGNQTQTTAQSKPTSTQTNSASILLDPLIELLQQKTDS